MNASQEPLILPCAFAREEVSCTVSRATVKPKEPPKRNSGFFTGEAIAKKVGIPAPGSLQQGSAVEEYFSNNTCVCYWQQPPLVSELPGFVHKEWLQNTCSFFSTLQARSYLWFSK